MSTSRTLTEQSIIRAENTLKAALAALDLPIRGSYCPGEVCAILGISDSTFWRLLRHYERDERGNLRRPDCLVSFTLALNRRVSYLELVDFIRRNDEYQRKTNDAEPPRKEEQGHDERNGQ